MIQIDVFFTFVKMFLLVLNSNAEILNMSAVLHMTVNAAKGLQDILKTKMLVGDAGNVKLTKYENIL